LRLGVLAILYLFLLNLLAALRRTLAPAERERRASSAIGRFVVVESSNPSLARGQTFPVQDVTSIGRAPTNTIHVDDPFVSGEHAVISSRGEELWIEDLGSTNGTFVNRRQLAAPALLQSGDVIQIGQVKIKLLR
jgi:pSer/pThr/pTyr-binding forkhead associated (FHA) protein